MLVATIDKMAELTELHCNLDGLTSLTRDYAHFEKAQIVSAFDKLEELRSRRPNLEIVFQGVPLSENLLQGDRFDHPAFILQYELMIETASETARDKRYPSFVHTDLVKILALAPGLSSRPELLKQFNIRCKLWQLKPQTNP